MDNDCLPAEDEKVGGKKVPTPPPMTYYYCQPVDESVHDAVNWIRAHEKFGTTEPVTFMITSPGGIVPFGQVLMDVIASSKLQFNILAVGLVASMASIWTYGMKNVTRVMTKRTRMMIHQPSGVGFLFKDEHYTVSSMRQTREWQEKMLSEITGKTTKEVRDWIEKDLWLSAEEALELKLIDAIY